MNKRISTVFFICIFLGLNALALPVMKTKHSTGLKPGTWKAVLQRPDGRQIIFNFTSERKNGRQVLYVLNAGEKLLVDSIVQKGDSLFIQMPFFASGFNVRIKADGNLEGVYIKKYADRNQVIPFFAVHGDKTRYAATVKPKYDLSGKWDVSFAGHSELETRAIGEFHQQGNGKLTGTFLTPTGDYRYLEGIVSGDSLKLSGFDGGHAVLFAAKVENDSSISDAVLFSGLKATQKWTALKDSLAELPDSYKLTRLRPGETKLNFSFVSTSGDTVSINDARYKNKVVIVQILGSWCPNCMDETAFLSKYYRENRDRGIEIIGLAYERSEDFNASKKALLPFQERFDVEYPFLITGVKVTDERRTEKTLPQIDAIKAFPTTIFIGKDGRVSKIDTGFNGPGTGVYYEEFKKEFNAEIMSLLSGGD